MSSARDKYVVAVSEARPAADGKPSASPIFRAAGSKDKLPSLEGVTTLFDLFERSVKLYAANQCLGARTKGADGKAGEFVWQTYSEVAADVASLASGLRAIGVNPKQRVGVLGPNSPYWMKALQVGSCGHANWGQAVDFAGLAGRVLRSRCCNTRLLAIRWPSLQAHFTAEGRIH